MCTGSSRHAILVTSEGVADVVVLRHRSRLQAQKPQPVSSLVAFFVGFCWGSVIERVGMVSSYVMEDVFSHQVRMPSTI